jgi:hypothetical protein
VGKKAVARGARGAEAKGIWNQDGNRKKMSKLK